MDHRTLIGSLRGRAETVLRPLLADGDRFALIDFPHYGNVGDSAIFLGQLSCLRDLSLPAPAYVCDLQTYDPTMLARRVGDGTILLAGGGGFGDLWPLSQRLREKIAVGFTDNRIVQLPQSIHFGGRPSLDRARRALESHPDFTLLAREEQSFELAREEFDVPVHLCPDMSLFLGPLERPLAPSRPVLWLARTDKEAKEDPWPPGGAAIRTDWLQEPDSALRSAADRLIRVVRRHPGSQSLRRLLTTLYPRVARERLRRGCRVLSQGRVVISDRLHGHVLSLLLGIPHVVHDNSYGKVSSFHRTWTSSSDLVRWASSRKEALHLAAEVLADREETVEGSQAPASGSEE